MKHATIVVRADWDDEADVWVASSTDVAGLAVEAATLEALNEKVMSALCDLIELNGDGWDGPEIPVHIMAEQVSRIPNPCR